MTSKFVKMISLDLVKLKATGAALSDGTDSGRIMGAKGPDLREEKTSAAHPYLRAVHSQGGVEADQGSVNQ